MRLVTRSVSPAPQRRVVSSALLLLADGRFPGGGHAHSGGLEAAAALEGVRDIAALESFLLGRAATTGRLVAAFAAAACAATAPLHPASGANRALAVLLELDGELDARMPAPSLRVVSRRLGRQLLRAARRIWPHAVLDDLSVAVPAGPHHAVALGAVAAAAGLAEADAAAAAVHDAVAGPAAAAVRLLGLDPYAVQAALARLGPELDFIASEAAGQASRPLADLPACGTPLLDILAEHHTNWEVRLFAS